MPAEQEKVAQLDVLAHWEHPGPGSYYDDIGDLSKSPHLVRGPELNTDPLVPLYETGFPGFMWDQGGYSRLRLSWQGSMTPQQMIYENIDPAGQYTIRINGGAAQLYVNRKKVEPALGPQTSQPLAETQPVDRAPRQRFTPRFKEFPIPQDLLKDRRIVVDWSDPNRPTAARMPLAPSATEIWLLKKQ